jgi:hypothetical protein
LLLRDERIFDPRPEIGLSATIMSHRMAVLPDHLNHSVHSVHDENYTKFEKIDRDAAAMMRANGGGIVIANDNRLMRVCATVHNASDGVVRLSWMTRSASDYPSRRLASDLFRTTVSVFS